MENLEVYIDSIKVKDNILIDNKILNIEETNGLRVLDYPVLYILYRLGKEVYIGETTQIRTRLKSHSKEKAKYEEALLIYHEMFNQSATYNIETNLINYFLADQKYKIDNMSQTSQKVTHNYFNKEYFNGQVFDRIWNKLQEMKFVDKDKVEIENSDIFKLSPFKSLTEEQIDIQNSIIEFCKTNINKKGQHVLIINGDAGTGKSVLLSSTFKKLVDLSNSNDNSLSGRKNNAVLVNHGEMLKTYKNISKNIKGMKVNQFYKPTSFINKKIKDNKSFDIILIDEAHLLLTQADGFNSYKGDNHLEDIINKSKITILFYDEMQVLKYKQYWDDSVLKNVISNHNTMNYGLTKQMRMNSNPETQEWINSLVNKKINKIPFDSTYELKIFNDASKMYEEIKIKNKKYGLSRVVSTFDYLHKKDGATYYVEEPNFKLPWNTTSDKESWAERLDTINEVGSIYSIQGFDLNYVAVILGPSVQYDKNTKELVIVPSLYKDVEAFRGMSILSNKKQAMIKEKIILNSLNVLLKRGTKGLYIYASNKELREELLRVYNDKKEIF